MQEISRRSFLFLTGGTGAAITVEPGRQMLNRLIPWVIPPDNILPGEWTFFATTCRECPAGCGMHLWHRDGRVTKAEGNPEHPVNRGGLCARGQASLQGLYDPDRVQKVYHSGQQGQPGPLGWAEAIAALAPALKAGKGRVTLISDLQTGTLAEVMRSFVGTFATPDRLLLFEAFNYQPLRTAHQKLFGQGIVPEYRLQDCDFIISFGADFLETWISPVGFASQFAAMHAWRYGDIGKLAYVGPRKSMTAGSADDFIQVPPGKERWVALAMLQEMSDQGWIRKHRQEIETALKNLDGKKAAARSGVPHDKLQRLTREFAQAEASVALAGPMAGRGAVAVDTAVAAGLLNAAAGRLGQTVDFTRPHALGQTATEEALEQWLKGVTAEDVIIIHHANLAYTRPHLVEKLRRAGTLVYLTDLPDETAEIADWVLPLDTFLESWGDYEPYAGIHSLLQPTMARLYDSRGAGDFLIALADAAGRPLSRPDSEAAPVDFTDWLRQRWRDLLRQKDSGGALEDAWRQALQRGGLWTQATGEQASLQTTADLRFAPAVEPPETPEQAELWLWPSIYFFDGRLANRAWLQEMPHPVSTIVWGSWLDIHPNKAKRLDLKEGDVVDVTTPAGTVAVPVRITEEVTPKTVALALGQGRTASRLSVARGVGVNGFLLLGGEAAAGFFPRVSLHPSGRRDLPVYLSATRDQYHRDFLKTVPLAHLRQMTMAEAEEIILPLPEGIRTGPRSVRSAPAQGAPLGHGRRPAEVHRLSCLLRGLLCREQHPGDGAHPGRAGAGDGLAEGAALPPRAPPGEDRLAPPALPALRCRPLRAGLPGVRRHAHRGGAERPDLQPLRRHPLLLEQLPLQGAPLQLVQYRMEGAAAVAAQPGSDGALPRGNGEMYFLRAAHPQGRVPGAPRRPAGAGWRNPAGLRAVLPGPGLHLRRPARPRLGDLAADSRRPAALSGAEGSEHQAGGLLPEKGGHRGGEKEPG